MGPNVNMYKISSYKR